MVRKADILDDLLENGYRSVPDLALAFGVDASTIRRHLARLEKLNLVQRTHGGALPIRHADTPFAVKQFSAFVEVTMSGWFGTWHGC